MKYDGTTKYFVFVIFVKNLMYVVLKKIILARNVL